MASRLCASIGANCCNKRIYPTYKKELGYLSSETKEENLHLTLSSDSSTIVAADIEAAAARDDSANDADESDNEAALGFDAPLALDNELRARRRARRFERDVSPLGDRAAALLYKSPII